MGVPGSRSGASSEAPATYTPDCAASCTRQTVLWIDDQVQPRDPIVRLLATEGVDVTVADTAAEGLRRAAEGGMTSCYWTSNCPTCSA